MCECGTKLFHLDQSCVCSYCVGLTVSIPILFFHWTVSSCGGHHKEVTGVSQDSIWFRPREDYDLTCLESLVFKFKLIKVALLGSAHSFTCQDGM